MIFSDLWGIAQEMRMQNTESVCIVSAVLYTARSFTWDFLVCFMVFKWVQNCDFI